MEILGIDIGGSSIKGAIVNTENGEILSDRIRIATPKPEKPKKVGEIIYTIATKLNYKGPIGAGYPGVVKNNVAFTAANVHKGFLGTNVAEVIEKISELPAVVINDADAAGLAEMRFGNGLFYRKGSVIILTIGTGIGSAFFIKGILFPNTELGHLKIRGKDAEHRAGDAARQEKDLSWKDWGEKLTEVLKVYESLFNPDIFILGGGASSRFEKFENYLKIDTKVIPAKLENFAGIIGAAMAQVEYKNNS